MSAKAGQSAVIGRVSCTKGKAMLVLCVAAGRAFCSPAQNTYALAVIDCTPKTYACQFFPQTSHLLILMHVSPKSHTFKCEYRVLMKVG